ncbi:NERD domain-containing protein [Ekhidna sp.]|uniref:nuclease-related domain-containing DEAD/DEAH box helicase n=1 Tax=Ekhidna sp. TaxID=2608089 RepID=UPI003CCBCC44
MLPPYIDNYCKSQAEEKLFKIFKNSSFTKDWIILHSLNLSQHVKRLYGEIDFLLLIPDAGIFVLEVKGGDVQCKDGTWYYINRFGKEFKSSIGPFNQARDAMFSLKKAVTKNYGRNHPFSRLATGFLCAFPDIHFKKSSIEYEHWQVLDRAVIENDPEGFFKKFTKESIEKFRGQKWFSEQDSIPDKEDIQEICEFLRGDFERIRSIRDRLKDFQDRVITYTGEQFRILDSILMNSNCLIQGSAGTGKTMIAIESAIRSAADGNKVFLTCFNKLVGEWMKKQVAEWSDKITVTNLHNYLFEISEGFDYDESKEGNNDFYSEYLPILISKMFEKGIFKKYDKIIIDEGQDLIRNSYLELFNSMLIGGLKNGSWEVYCDFERQAIYSQLTKSEMLGIIDGYSSPTKFLLKINCRNTRQIGEETALISGFDQPPFLLEYLEGIPVQYFFYRDNEHQKKLIEDCFIKLRKDNLPDIDLKFLSPRKYKSSVVSTLTNIKAKEINSFNEAEKYGYYGFSTVHAFKGLESHYVVITDIEDLTKAQTRSLLYVGMSRAKYGLILFISESMQDEYKKLLELKMNKL